MGDDVNHSDAKAGVPTAAYQPSRLGAIEELPLALGFILFNDGDFRRSIEDGINSGRDTDSIGVMAGAILGALHGEAVIAAADRATLDSANRFDLTAAADRFAATATRILLTDRDDRLAADRARETLLAPTPPASVVNL
jgi:ADP-ribosylglycohydrolase